MNILEEAQKMAEVYDIRLGQAVYNIAYGRNPAVAQLVGSDVDPFYHDSRIDAFLETIGETPNT